jgi:hypothetical protein
MPAALTPPPWLALELGAIIVNTILLVFWGGRTYQMVRDQQRRTAELEKNQLEHARLIASAGAVVLSINERLSRLEWGATRPTPGGEASA